MRLFQVPAGSVILRERRRKSNWVAAFQVARDVVKPDS